MVEFTHYFIYGNPPEDFTREKMEEWSSTVPKKFSMELVYFGISIGTTEDLVIVLKGKIFNMVYKNYFSQKSLRPKIKMRVTTLQEVKRDNKIKGSLGQRRWWQNMVC